MNKIETLAVLDVEKAQKSPVIARIDAEIARLQAQRKRVADATVAIDAEIVYQRDVRVWSAVLDPIVEDIDPLEAGVQP